MYHVEVRAGGGVDQGLIEGAHVDYWGALLEG